MPSYRRFPVPLRPAAEAVVPRSYGRIAALVQIFARASVLAAVFAALLLGFTPQADATERPVKIVALGDSLTAGFGLPATDAFPAKLEKALRAKGLAVEVANAGVSGDTAPGGLARLDWSVPPDTDAVILELGANDMLQGRDPQRTRQALDEIVRKLNERRITVLLAGMRAAPNLGGDYARDFEPIFPELAAKYDLLFYPFFLDGIVSDAKLNQRDGLHPTAKGVDAIVAGILPKVEELVARVRQKRGS
jgi:acyl-CoA thioesterase I